MQSLWPVLTWNWPAGQLWQTSPLSKRPASHFVQNVCPINDCTEPSGHGLQLAWFFSVEIVCGAQSSHSAAVELMKVPGVQEPQ